MKKFFPFLMALCMVTTVSAQSAMVLEGAKAPQAKTSDTIKISDASWTCNQVSSTEYQHVLKDNATNPTYEFNIDCMAYAAESMVGTFAVADPDSWDMPDDYIDETNSNVVTYSSDASTTTDYLEFGSSVTVTESATGKDLNAIIVAGGNIYSITAHQATRPAAKKTVTLNYTTTGQFFATKSMFGLSAKDKFAEVSTDSIATYLVIKSNPKNVAGTYATADFVDGTYVAYEGTETRKVNFWDEVSATITEDETNYICNAEIFGMDTILYQISLKAPKPKAITPKDTVKIVAKNLTTTYDVASSSIGLDASNADGDVVSLTLTTNTLYGNYTLSNVKMGSIKHNGLLHSVSMAFDVNLTLEQTDDLLNQLTGTVLGNDTVLYVLDLVHYVPAAKDTVKINFATVGESCYYTNQEYFFMYNADDKYLMAMEVNTVQPENMYAYVDFNRSYTHLGVISATDTTDVLMLNCFADVTKLSDTQYQLKADFLGSDTIAYVITSTFNYTESHAIEYDAVTGSVDRSYNASDNVVTRVEDAENMKVFFRATSLSESDMVGLYFYVEDTTETLIPAGEYDIDDSGAAGTVYACQGIDTEDGLLYPSYYGTLNASGNLSSVYMIVSGKVTVAYVDGQLTFTVDAKNSNELPVKIVYDGTKTAIENVTTNSAASKFVQNGTIYIRHNNRTYNSLGVLVK